MSRGKRLTKREHRSTLDVFVLSDEDRERFVMADLQVRAEIIVAKNRRGPTGIANLEWHAETAQFKSAVRGQEWNRDA